MSTNAKEATYRRQMEALDAHRAELKKPAEVRMGSGKGAPDHWVAVVKPGRILFEMAGVDHDSAIEAMRLASHKLPVATKFVTREHMTEGSGDGHR